jgi:hypothetical protein
MLQQDTTQLLSDSTRVLPDSLAKLDSLAAVDSLRLVDSLKSVVHLVIPRGYVGIPHPSLPQSESWVFIVLVMIFFLFVFSISRSAGLITETAKTFFLVKERSSIFSKATVSDFRFRFYFMLFSISVLSLYAYLTFYNSSTHFSTHFSLLNYSYFLVITGFFLVLKSLIFDLIGYVFLSPPILKMAKDSYFNIVIILGFILYPLLILQLYIPSNYYRLIELICLIVCVSAVILVIIKLFQIFFHKIVAFFYILLYLCTLEILPLILLYKVYKWIVFKDLH